MVEKPHQAANPVPPGCKPGAGLWVDAKATGQAAWARTARIGIKDG